MNLRELILSHTSKNRWFHTYQSFSNKNKTLGSLKKKKKKAPYWISPIKKEQCISFGPSRMYADILGGLKGAIRELKKVVVPKPI